MLFWNFSEIFLKSVVVPGKLPGKGCDEKQPEKEEKEEEACVFLALSTSL